MALVKASSTNMQYNALRLVTRYLDDGSIEMDNSAAERALRTVALGRKNYLFAGSDAGGERAAAFYTLLGTAKLNGLDPELYLRHVLERIANHPVNRIHELLPSNLAALPTPSHLNLKCPLEKSNGHLTPLSLTPALHQDGLQTTLTQNLIAVSPRGSHPWSPPGWNASGVRRQWCAVGVPSLVLRTGFL